MKRVITSFLFGLVFTVLTFAQTTRYVDAIFDSVDVTTDIVYGQNFSVLVGTPIPTGTNGLPALAFDLYEPKGDTILERPLVIHLHTGTFAPIIHNGNPTGARNDFATTEMCEGYAKRGYVVANLEYRLGWNPGLLTQAERAADLMKAVYRAIQDCKSAVRYFRKDYASGNAYRIDTSRIVLSGQGSGGWVALGYATVNKLSEIQLAKFLDLSDPMNPVALIDTAVLGDWDGYGGSASLNMVNNAGYSNEIDMVLSMGGGIGDLSWLEAGDVPMVAVHCPTDQVAHYTTGDVSVPLIGVVTTEISGAYDIMKKVDSLGNNDVLLSANFTDPYTTAALSVDTGLPNVFAFLTGNPYEGSPWDYWDSTYTVNMVAPAVGLTAQDGIDAHQSGLQTNPNMGLYKSLAYLDSTVNFFAYRMAYVLGLYTTPGVGNSEISFNNYFKVYPNPAGEYVVVEFENNETCELNIYSIAGKLIKSIRNLKNKSEIDIRDLSKGTYLVEVISEKNSTTFKLMKN